MIERRRTEKIAAAHVDAHRIGVRDLREPSGILGTWRMPQADLPANEVAHVVEIAVALPVAHKIRPPFETPEPRIVVERPFGKHREPAGSNRAIGEPPEP